MRRLTSRLLFATGARQKKGSSHFESDQTTDRCNPQLASK